MSCLNCGKPDTKFNCSACGPTFRYCSTTCQHLDWEKFHSKICLSMKEGYREDDEDEDEDSEENVLKKKKGKGIIKQKNRKGDIN